MPLRKEKILLDLTNSDWSDNLIIEKFPSNSKFLAEKDKIELFIDLENSIISIKGLNHLVDTLTQSQNSHITIVSLKLFNSNVMFSEKSHTDWLLKLNKLQKLSLRMILIPNILRQNILNILQRHTSLNQIDLHGTGLDPNQLIKQGRIRCLNEVENTAAYMKDILPKLIMEDFVSTSTVISQAKFSSSKSTNPISQLPIEIISYILDIYIISLHQFKGHSVEMVRELDYFHDLFQLICDNLKSSTEGEGIKWEKKLSKFNTVSKKNEDIVFFKSRKVDKVAAKAILNCSPKCQIM